MMGRRQVRCPIPSENAPASRLVTSFIAGFHLGYIYTKN